MFFDHIRRLPVVDENYEKLLRETLEFPSTSIRRARGDYRGVRDYVIYSRTYATRYRVSVGGITVEHGKEEGWIKVFVPDSNFGAGNHIVKRYFRVLEDLSRDYRNSKSLWTKLKGILNNPWGRIVIIGGGILYFIVTLWVLFP